MKAIRFPYERLAWTVALWIGACGTSAAPQPVSTPTSTANTTEEPSSVDAPHETAQDESEPSASAVEEQSAGVLTIIGSAGDGRSAFENLGPARPTVRVGVPTCTPQALPRAAVTAAIEEQSGTIAGCYNADLYARLQGELGLRFLVHAGGRVMSASVTRGFDDRAELCIADKVEHWSFSPLPDGGVMRVEVTLTFTPAPE